MFAMYIVFLATVNKLHYPGYLRLLNKRLYRIKVTLVIVSWFTWILLRKHNKIN